MTLSYCSGRLSASGWQTTDDEMPPDLIAELMPGLGIGLLSGHPRGGKTWLCLLFSMAVASGECICGMEVDPRGQRVTYITEEDPRVVTKSRIRAMRAWVVATYGAQAGERLDANLRVSIRNGLNLDDAVTQLRVRATLLEQQPALVIIEPLRSVTHRTDQGPEVIRQWLQSFIRGMQDAFRQAHSRELTIWLGHHDRKPGKDNNGQTTTPADDDPHQISGGGIVSFCDTVIRCIKFKEAEAKAADGGKIFMTRVRVVPQAYKYFLTPKPFVIEITAHATLSRRRLTFTSVSIRRPMDVGLTPAELSIEQGIMAAFARNRGAQHSAREWTLYLASKKRKHNRDTVTRVLNRLVEHNRLAVHGTSRRERTYGIGLQFDEANRTELSR
jgi:RecA-family ATPase